MPFTYPNCQTCTSQCVAYDDVGNRIVGKQLESLCCYFQDHDLKGSIEAVLQGAEQRIREASSRLYPAERPPSDQSLRNLYGAWFETSIGIVFNKRTLRYNSRSNNKLCVVKLPNARTFQFWELFDDDAREKIEGLFETLERKGSHLTMSNPDLVCIQGLEEELVDNVLRPVDEKSLDSLKILEESYPKLRHMCPYNSIKFGVALKTELRPDRRYQIVYEGSVVKAIVSHLQARFWDIDFSTSYFGLVLRPPTDADEIVLTNPSIDSLVDIHVPPRKAVDELVACRTVEVAESVVDRWLES